jgi:hypothetical protein
MTLGDTRRRAALWSMVAGGLLAVLGNERLNVITRLASVDAVLA